jgi:hypothetical protein
VLSFFSQNFTFNIFDLFFFDSNFLFFQDLFTESLPIMREIRRTGKLCDIVIKVEDQSFSAHRIVLAATIPYFYGMFSQEYQESKKKEIVMKEIEATSLESLINFAYSGLIKIDSQNVQNLMVNIINQTCKRGLFIIHSPISGRSQFSSIKQS